MAHKHHLNIYRQQRNPEKFDVLDLFDTIGRDRKYILGNERDAAAFIDTIRTALSVNNTPTMTYGRRTEAMFAYIVASLGKCTLIKKEDNGDVFADSVNTKIPDYRIVLNTEDREQIFVEVKNYHSNNTFDEYNMNIDYLDSLLRYADIMKTKLFIALYWSKCDIWTMISPKDFLRKKTQAIISFESAMKRNQMSILGDFWIGTTPPLSIRIYPDKQQPHNISKDHMIEFTIGNIELLCKSTLITSENEQRIAFALMLFGNWRENRRIINDPHSENQIQYIEFLYYPEEHDIKQGFCMIDALSTIISRQYKQLTAPNGQVLRISPNIEPGMLGFVIPEEYSSETLPLWRFHIQANHGL